MSADSAVTYTSVHSEVRSWSIPPKDPYEEAAQQLLEQAPRSYVPDPIELEDHVPLHIHEHHEDLVPAEDEATIEAYILEVASVPTPPLPPSFLSLRIRPLHTRAAMAQMRAAVPSTYHSLLPSGTPPLLPIPLLVPSTSRRAEIPEADTPPQKRLLLTAPKLGCEVGECSAATEDRATVRAKIEVLRRERIAYEQESIQIREALAGSEAYSRTLEARVAVPWRLEHALTHWRTLVAVPRIGYDCIYYADLINQGVAPAMAEAEASRVRNGYDSNGSGPRLAQAVRECKYPYFLKCQPLNFKGTEGVVGLTQWFEKMESVFNIINCTTTCQVKYAACTLQGVALTWWNSHVKTVTLKVAQA
nr:hypothetical protein [Tanacetum cinerariifolium]